MESVIDTEPPLHGAPSVVAGPRTGQPLPLDEEVT